MCFAMQMYIKINAAVKEARPRRLLITGLSLGGSLAPLIGYHISQSLPDIPLSVVTFGAGQVRPAFL
jgi:putative lipase involved disintegration of autophagic bodies